jgi:DNA modification methylase
MTDCWHFPVTAGKEREQAEGHATPKPVALCERAVKTSCPMGGVVIDLFGGSGSTLIAAENTGRRCYAMEIQERFADVIVRRWQNLTGKQAVRESDGRLFDEI